MYDELGFKRILASFNIILILIMHLSLYVPTYHSAGIGGDRVGI